MVLRVPDSVNVVNPFECKKHAGGVLRTKLSRGQREAFKMIKRLKIPEKRLSSEEKFRENFKARKIFRTN